MIDRICPAAERKWGKTREEAMTFGEKGINVLDYDQLLTSCSTLAPDRLQADAKPSIHC